MPRHISRVSEKPDADNVLRFGKGLDTIAPSFISDLEMSEAGPVDIALEEQQSITGPSLQDSEPDNPTLIPTDILKQFYFTFLTRNPLYALPSYYRTFLPPLVERTGLCKFDPPRLRTIGYRHVRRLFDYLRSQRLIGPNIAGSGVQPSGGDEVDILVIDAEDLLEHPEAVISAYCKAVGINYSPEILDWGSEDAQMKAAKAFAKWGGVHDDAINSRTLMPKGNLEVSRHLKLIIKSLICE